MEQANLSLLVPQPWAKVTESPSSTFPQPIFFCRNYLSFSSKGFDVRSKSCCGISGWHRRGNEVKT